jgi:hypothetical protein
MSSNVLVEPTKGGKKQETPAVLQPKKKLSKQDKKILKKRL